MGSGRGCSTVGILAGVCRTHGREWSRSRATRSARRVRVKQTLEDSYPTPGGRPRCRFTGRLNGANWRLERNVRALDPWITVAGCLGGRNPVPDDGHRVLGDKIGSPRRGIRPERPGKPPYVAEM